MYLMSYAPQVSNSPDNRIQRHCGHTQTKQDSECCAKNDWKIVAYSICITHLEDSAVVFGKHFIDMLRPVSHDIRKKIIICISIVHLSYNDNRLTGHNIE